MAGPTLARGLPQAPGGDGRPRQKDGSLAKFAPSFLAALLPAGNLPGGQQQMPGRPRVLVPDEPSLGPARIVVSGIPRTLARLARRRPDDPADRAGGHLVLQGGRDEMLASGEVVKHYLGSADAA